MNSGKEQMQERIIAREPWIKQLNQETCESLKFMPAGIEQFYEYIRHILDIRNIHFFLVDYRLCSRAALKYVYK